MSIQVFLSYAYEDKNLLDKLIEHLNPLKRESLIDVWYDQLVTAGTELGRAVRKSLLSADLILLLISPAFLSSDYCYSEEMVQALARHDAGNTRVIPLLLRPVDWHNTPFGKLRALPSPATPVTLWSNRDQAFYNVAKGIRETVEELLAVREIDQQDDRDGTIDSNQDNSRWNLDYQKDDMIARMEALNRQRMPERKYVLVSSAQEDEDTAISVVSQMKSYYGFPHYKVKCIYQTNLKSDRRINTTVKNAFAILLIISPYSRDSTLVEKAIQVGRAHECPICPMWVAGSTEKECLPVSATNLKLVDCRPAGNTSFSGESVWPMVRSLSQTIADRSPHHIRLRSGNDFSSLPGYTRIAFGGSSEDDIAIRCSLYPSFGLFLDDIYVKYLKDRYDPLTYGEKWLLARDIDSYRHERHDPGSNYCRLFALSWNWAFHSNNDRSDRELRLRDFEAPPEKFGMQTGTRWRIIEDLPDTLFGIATNNGEAASIFASTFGASRADRDRLMKVLEKAQMYHGWEGIVYHPFLGRKEGVRIRAVHPSMVNPDAYKFLFIFATPVLEADGSNSTAAPGSLGERSAESPLPLAEIKRVTEEVRRINIALEEILAEGIRRINTALEELKNNVSELPVDVADQLAQSRAVMEEMRQIGKDTSLKKSGSSSLENEHSYQETSPKSRSFSLPRRCVFLID